MIHRSYIADGHGGQIHVTESGQQTESQASIFLLHQTPRSWDEFREVMENLSNTFHLIAIDLPGMGGSSAPTKNPTIEIYAQAAARAIEHFGGAPMIVCGHHTGGVVAVELAAKRPDLVESLILSSTPWLDPEVRLQRSKKTPIDTAPRKQDGSHLTNLWQQRVPFYPEGGEYLDRFIKDALRATDPAEGHHVVSQYHMEKTAPKITSPVLLVEHGLDPYASKHSSHMRTAFSKAEVEVIPNGHAALEVTAPQFSKILRNWCLR